MKKVELGSSGLSVTQLCMGCMQLGSRAFGDDVADLLDCYRDAGGNFFDTAHCYCFWTPGGAGKSERLLGDYVRDNGCREEVIIATKGAHPPADSYRKNERFMTSYRVRADIDDSLARLHLDTIDLYWLHRDDPGVPVSEILDMLHEEVERGRIRAFGGSNWTSQRLAEANQYADEHGMDGFVGSQPRLSLLEYEEQSEEERLEPGVLLHANDRDRKWHAESQLPMMAYGSTGNGFFANEGEEPEKFISPENTARAERTMCLAEQLGVTPNQVALAWLMNQPFPIIPILGTASVDHLEDALGALELDLSPEQVAWLEDGE